MKYYLKYILSYNRLIFHEYRLDDLIQQPKNENYFFDMLDTYNIHLINDILSKQEIKSEFDFSKAKARLQMGYYCFIVKYLDEIVGYFWIATNYYHIPYCNATVYLKDDEVIGLNAYILPTFRGLNLFNQLKKYALLYLYNRDFKKYIGMFFSWNKASKQANLKFGSNITGSIYFGYILLMKYQFTNIPNVHIVFHDNMFAFFSKAMNKITNSKE